MIAADYAVQIKLIIMYAIGLAVLAALFIYLHHLAGRWFNRFSGALLIIIIVMLIILTVVSRLP